MRQPKALMVVGILAGVTFAVATTPAAAALPGQHEAWWGAVQGFHALARDAALSPGDRVAGLVQSLKEELAAPTTPEPSLEGFAWKLSLWTPHELTLQHLGQALAEVGDAGALRAALADKAIGGDAREWVLVALGLAGVPDLEEADGAVLGEVVRIAAGSPDTCLRCNATRALRHVGEDDQVIPVFDTLLEDPAFRPNPLWSRPEVITVYKLVVVSPTEIKTEAKQIDLSKDPYNSWDRQYIYPVRMEAFFALRARGVPVERDPDNINHYTVREEAPVE